MIMIRLGAMLRKLVFSLPLSLVFLFIGCVSLRGRVLSAEEEADLYPVASYVPETFDWQEILVDAGDGEKLCAVPGVWRFDFESEDPKFPLIYHAVKIELSSPEGAGSGEGGNAAEFTSSPKFASSAENMSSAEGAGAEKIASSPDGAVSETSGSLILFTSRWELTSDFAARENCLVAMNATPFDKTELAGIHKVDGKIISRPVARYAALGLRCTEDGAVMQGRVFESQEDGELAGWNAAFGGFFVVLRDGEVCTEFIRRHTSRSGAGVSADGRTLYLLVVEGERQQKSRGLSYPQCGEIFRAMGCSDALEFDGGGSSELCINGQSVMSYRVRRMQGNSFGFGFRLPRR